MNTDLVDRLKKRAQIRRTIPTRKSVQLAEPDRLADLLDEAAAVLESRIDYRTILKKYIEQVVWNEGVHFLDASHFTSEEWTAILEVLTELQYDV